MTVNKVVNIEIAKQVFWIEELGYQTLQTYLEKLKQQLATQEFGDEIFEDIELRFAELFYGVNEGKQRAITLEQAKEFIAQVGYLGDEESVDEPVEKTTPKTYLDDNNKIVAGVCAGLSLRFNIPALLMRLAFTGAIAAFGFGIVMYLILWFSFDKNNSRNKMLASKGEAATAQKIAEVVDVPKSKFLTVQQLLFLPFSVIGLVIHVVVHGIFAQRALFRWLLKNILLVVLLVVLVSLGVGISEFNHDQIYYQWVQWILSAATIYLMVVGGVVFIREYYLEKPRRPVNRTLKMLTTVPIALIITSVFYLMVEMSDEKQLTRQVIITPKNNMMTLAIVEPKRDNYLARDVDIELVTVASDMSDIQVSLVYFSNGRSEPALSENIEAIDYQYSISDNVLTLNRYFQLFPETFNRGQRVTVRIEVPQQITIDSSHLMLVNIKRESLRYIIDEVSESTNVYRSASNYLHEFNELDNNRITSNERLILLGQFCDVFFAKLHWRCMNSEEMPALKDERFDTSFQDDRDTIYALLTKIKQVQTLDIKSLTELSSTIAILKKKHPQVEELSQYIQHLILIKRPPS